MNETQVVRLWESLLESGRRLTTDTGEPFEIVYPGRQNDDHGADLRDVVIVSPRGRERGSIEFHVRSGDWRSHGHHRDTAYRNVVLHVVMRDDGAPICISGRAIPTLSLSRYLNTGLGGMFRADEITAKCGIPCENAFLNFPGKVLPYLEAAGEARFQEKAALFRQELSGRNAAQVLYWGILGALGYIRNKEPCLTLAERVPLPDLADNGDLLENQALLLGAAGLLPSQCYKSAPPVSAVDSAFKPGFAPSLNADQDDFVQCLETIWRRRGHRKTVPLQSWNLYRVRPNNSPVRRIAAMAYLLQRYGRRGLFESIRTTVKEVPADKACRLRETMVVAGDGYWLDHFSFGVTSPQQIPYLVGNNRAGEITVNVLLPFMYAWAGLNSDFSLAAKAAGLYRAFPGLASNSIEKHLVRQLGLNAGALSLANRRQGLLHVYKKFCIRGRCGECGLAKLRS